MVGNQTQPRLISLDTADLHATLELFPGVWQAAEQLGDPDKTVRNQALDELLQTEAHRISPLIAYLLTTRIVDPDLRIRMRIVETLANVMRRDAEGRYAIDAVRSHVISGLANFGDVGILTLLELASIDEGLIPHINKLLNFIPKSGEYLKEVAGDRSKSIDLRKIAIYFIGKLGYIDAENELRRIRNRIEAKQGSQKRMPFAPPAVDDSEEILLQEIKKTLSILRIE